MSNVFIYYGAEFKWSHTRHWTTARLIVVVSSAPPTGYTYSTHVTGSPSFPRNFCWAHIFAEISNIFAKTYCGPPKSTILGFNINEIRCLCQTAHFERVDSFVIPQPNGQVFLHWSRSHDVTNRMSLSGNFSLWQAYAEAFLTAIAKTASAQTTSAIEHSGTKEMYLDGPRGPVALRDSANPICISLRPRYHSLRMIPEWCWSKWTDNMSCWCDQCTFWRNVSSGSPKAWLSSPGLLIG